jgi:hypothetical protein
MNNIGNYFFAKCWGLSDSLTGISNIGVGFAQECVSLKDATIYFADSMGTGLFNNCKNLRTVRFFYTLASAAPETSDVFVNCPNLEAIYVKLDQVDGYKAKWPHLAGKIIGRTN